MSKKPTFITCQPIDTYWIWQNHAYIESCLEAGFETKDIHILLYHPLGREMNNKWYALQEIYPDLNIHVYQDQGISKFIPVYIPLLRPHIMRQHFEKYPHLKDETIVYTDCDILWTPSVDIRKLFDDDVNYISDASSYLNVSYFDSKYAHALESKKEEFSKKDFLKEICDLVGIDKNVLVQNNNNTGGVQYILKNVDAQFWDKVQRDTLAIRVYFQNINREFYESEDRGIQSWCADLWGMQWNLWLRGGETKVVPEMNFSWSTDSIERLKQTGIFHNAGVTGERHGTTPMFHKGKYHMGTFPFDDDFLYNEVVNNEENKKLCNNYYLRKVLQLKEKYNLKYH
jgi:hypothetical protein